MNIQQWLRHQLGQCQELFLPAVCPWCGNLLAAPIAAPDVCRPCRQSIQPCGPACCPCCARPHLARSGPAHYCEACLRNPPPFEKVHAVGLFRGPLQKAIHTFKYRDDPALAATLGKLLIETLAAGSDAFRPDLVVAIPLHPRRLRQRGYNQASELAKLVSRSLQVPLDVRLLDRVRVTLPQQDLTAKARLSNLRGAFAATRALAGESILLIDDVMTTGATLRESAQVLAQSGAGRIRAAILGRA